MTRLVLAVSAALAAPNWLFASDPLAFEKSIKKEPAYQTKSPRYGLIAFGPEAKDRVWVVFDGNALYVDRNGNGDLTDPGEKVEAKKPTRPRDDSDGYQFDVGELSLGGRTHKAATVFATPLKVYNDGELGKRADVKAELARDPKALVFGVQCDVEVPGVKGGGVGGRLTFSAGPLDLNGLLLFAGKPAAAPVVHFGGPLQVTFYGELPTMRVGRDSEFVLVVGTPGAGNGTFAMLGYEGTIPKESQPAAEVTYQPKKPGDPPVKEKYEIKERC
jgi:hypothetical protein